MLNIFSDQCSSVCWKIKIFRNTTKQPDSDIKAKIKMHKKSSCQTAVYILFQDTESDNGTKRFKADQSKSSSSEVIHFTIELCYYVCE